MKLDIAEKHLIIVETSHGNDSLELLLLKKPNLKRPTYRIAVAFGTQGKPKIHYPSWYMEHKFAFGWTALPSKAGRFSEQQAKRVVADILQRPDMFTGVSNYLLADL